MLLHRGLHDLAGLRCAPHPHHALLAPAHNAAGSGPLGNGRDGAVVRVVDREQQLAGLRAKHADAAVAPATQDRAPVLWIGKTMLRP